MPLNLTTCSALRMTSKVFPLLRLLVRRGRPSDVDFDRHQLITSRPRGSPDRQPHRLQRSQPCLPLVPHSDRGAVEIYALATRSLAERARDPLGAECVVGAAGLEPTTRPLSAAGSNLCEQRRRGQETNGRRQRRFVFKSSPSAAHLNNSPPSRVTRKGQRFRVSGSSPALRIARPLRFGGSYTVARLSLVRYARPTKIMKYLVSALGFEPRTY